MEDFLTVEEKAHLDKEGATLVSGKLEMPFPPEFKKQYDGYHVMYKMVGSTTMKDAKGNDVHLGCPPGRALVAIASPENREKLYVLIESLPDYNRRNFLPDIIECNPPIRIAVIPVHLPRQ